MDRSQKLINPFVSETSPRVFVYVLYYVLIEIIMVIQYIAHSTTYV